MNLLYVITDNEGNIAYSLDVTNWTLVNKQSQHIEFSYDQLYWFPITKEVKNILACIKRNEIKGVVKLKEYIQQHVKL